MGNNTVAYVGLDNFDIILYISRVLMKLGKKVLLVDHSETMAIKYCIPQPKGLNCQRDIITYQGVDFTSKILSKQMQEEYDDILILYGYQEPTSDLELCNRICFVTDLYISNQERLMNLIHGYSSTGVKDKSLLIKHKADIKVRLDYLFECFHKEVNPEHITVLYYNEIDEINALVCQYHGVYKFKDISKYIKNFILDEVKKLHPEIRIKMITNAFRLARKGN